MTRYTHTHTHTHTHSRTHSLNGRCAQWPGNACRAACAGKDFGPHGAIGTGETVASALKFPRMPSVGLGRQGRCWSWRESAVQQDSVYCQAATTSIVSYGLAIATPWHIMHTNVVLIATNWNNCPMMFHITTYGYHVTTYAVAIHTAHKQSCLRQPSPSKTSCSPGTLRCGSCSPGTLQRCGSV